MFYKITEIISRKLCKNVAYDGKSQEIHKTANISIFATAQGGIPETNTTSALQESLPFIDYGLNLELQVMVIF